MIESPLDYTGRITELIGNLLGIGGSPILFVIIFILIFSFIIKDKGES
ncbi:MAG: hypothetical protein H8E55_46390 [Pelagibacterales bacterium]|nr:hypothetical protein [Pelagibacterales bacterium]